MSHDRIGFGASPSPAPRRDTKRGVFGTLRALFSHQWCVPAWVLVLALLLLCLLAAWCLRLDSRVHALERSEYQWTRYYEKWR